MFKIFTLTLFIVLTFRLINNCLGCGRVVCLQENSGPCLFCGELVCTNEERTSLQKDSNKSNKLYKTLISREGGKALQTDPGL